MFNVIPQLIRQSYPNKAKQWKDVTSGFTLMPGWPHFDLIGLRYCQKYEAKIIN